MTTMQPLVTLSEEFDVLLDPDDTGSAYRVVHGGRRVEVPASGLEWNTDSTVWTAAERAYELKLATLRLGAEIAVRQADHDREMVDFAMAQNALQRMASPIELDEPTDPTLSMLWSSYQKSVDALESLCELIVGLVMSARRERAINDQYDDMRASFESQLGDANELLEVIMEGSGIDWNDFCDENQDLMQQALDFIDQLKDTEEREAWLETFLEWLDEEGLLIKGAGSRAKASGQELWDRFETFMSQRSSE